MKKRLSALLVLLIFLLCACELPAKKTAPLKKSVSEGDVLFHFIDVGQGDCIFIQSEASSVLIDAGTYESSSDVYNYLERLGIDYIDCFILTHAHDDHIGGAPVILKNIDVGAVYMNGEGSSSYSYEKLLDTLISEDISPKVPEKNSIYNVGELKLKFLSPVDYYESENDNSIVTYLEYGETSALFMGDAEKNVEKFLIENDVPEVDILKVGHHGSRNASTQDFLRTIRPSVSVIQCGKDNSYAHPHKEAVERIQKFCPEILRTDELGSIVLSSDGKAIYSVDGEEFEEAPEVSEEKLSYIGNKKSKKLHTGDCSNLPSEKNRVVIEDKEKAIEEGYKPCGNCNP